MRLPRVLLLTDRHQLPAGRSLPATVARCVDAGLAAVLLRELDLDQAARAALAADLAATGATVIAARTRLPHAAAVHLAAHQPAPDNTSGPHGRSCHDEAEVRRAVAAGAAYLTVSPVAASASKPGYGPALGPDGVRRAAEFAGAVPVFALGGVDAGNAAALREAGAFGVAVMGAVMRAEAPAAVLGAILEQVA